jgi:hypothetical protein
MLRFESNVLLCFIFHTIRTVPVFFVEFLKTFDSIVISPGRQGYTANAVLMDHVYETARASLCALIFLASHGAVRFMFPHITQALSCGFKTHSARAFLHLYAIREVVKSG